MNSLMPGEDTYKKGQLTLWIFLALRDERKCVDQIKPFVETMSRGTITCEEQSLYRALRKYYYLTSVGEQLFTLFVERNIRLFFSPEIKKLLKIG